MIELIAFLAGILGIISWVPQIVKTLKTKRADDISIGMLWVALGSCVLYLIYGIALSLTPVIIMLSLTALVIVILMLLIYKFQAKQNKA